jgi:hypothetical protein
MNTHVDRIQVGVSSSLYSRPHTLADYQRLSRSYLQEMRDLHSAFRDLAVLGTNDFVPLRADISDLEHRILEVISQPKECETHLNSRANERPSADTMSRIGFSVTYFSHSEDETRSHLPTELGGVKLALHGNSASAETSGGIILTLPTNEQQELHSAANVRRFLAAALTNWDSAVGSVRSLQYEKQIEQAGDIYSGQWLLYLPFPYLGECLPPDIRWEPFHDGILIETTPHPPNVNDPADVAAGKRVREVLDKFGFAWQSTYAIHGWPPDEEEWRYEEFITGAPSGRKYRVRCIDFDGYDARRKVLLYAKLFRRLRRQPKQWGLRGWDGPVVNEARRQVRAAQGEPIEWHIGLEEPADRVRTLLADYTDITENQLKVIYTPLDLALRTEVPPKEFPT